MPNVRGNDPADISNAQAQQQYDAVKPIRDAQGRLPAPNGKPSKLTEGQWRQVRTPNFKRWFGDWELAAKTLRVVNIPQPQGVVGDIRSFVRNRARSLVSAENRFVETAIGRVEITSAGIDKATSHRNMTDAQYQAVLSVRELLESAVLVTSSSDTKNRPNIRQIHTLYAAANVERQVVPVKLIVREMSDGNRYYDQHLLEIKTPAGNVAVDSPVADSTIRPSAGGSSITIGDLLPEVKKNISKVMDDNGEPMVVYHATWNDFEVFNRKQMESQRVGLKIDTTGSFFTTDPVSASKYAGGSIMPVFLNIRKPIRYEGDGQQGGFISFRNQVQREGGVEKYRQNAADEGYDGLMIVDDMLDHLEGDVIVAFNPNQIKSATGNKGTFDPADERIQGGRVPNVRGNDRSDAPDVEAQQQYDAVKPIRDAQGRLLAPNGKPSKLTEGQWRRVRTPNFKRWFGDWEAAARLQQLLEQARQRPLVNKATGQAIQLSMSGFKETRQHSADTRVMRVMNRLDTLIQEAIPLWTNTRTDPDHRNVKAWHYLGARVQLDGQSGYVKLLVREDNNGHWYYDNDFTEVETIEGLIKHPTPNPNRAEAPSDLHVNSIGRWVDQVKRKPSSQVIDDNGEPMVVYHGTSNNFSTFRDTGRTDYGYYGQGYYFTPYPEAAGEYALIHGSTGANLMPVFLRLKTPYVHVQNTSHPTPNQSGDFAAKLAEKGYDGVVVRIRDTDDSTGTVDTVDTQYVAFEPTQIKSATGNRGTFDADNPDIRAGRVPGKSLSTGKVDFAPGQARDFALRQTKAATKAGRAIQQQLEMDTTGKKVGLRSIVAYLVNAFGAEMRGGHLFIYDDVPQTRVLGVYWMTKKPGSGEGLLYDDEQNEFLADLDGLVGHYVGRAVRAYPANVSGVFG